MDSWIEVRAVDRKTADLNGRANVITGLHWFAVARDAESNKVIRHPHHTALPLPKEDAPFVEYADADHETFVSWLYQIEGPNGLLVEDALRVAREALAKELQPEVVTESVVIPPRDVAPSEQNEPTA